MASEVDPALGWVEGPVSAAGFDARGDSEAGDGVTNHLALAAAQAADRIAHEEDLGKVVAAQRGTAEVLAGTELALDGDAVVRVDSEIGSAFVRGVRVVVRPSASAFVFVLEFHLNV